jgi:hypothetical protein
LATLSSLSRSNRIAEPAAFWISAQSGVTAVGTSSTMSTRIVPVAVLPLASVTV